MKNDDIVKVILTVIITGLLLIVIPGLTFWLGYFGGWLFMKFVGDRLAEGLNLLFNTTRFTPSLIPLVCGSLSVIGGYFRSTNHSSKK